MGPPVDRSSRTGDTHIIDATFLRSYYISSDNQSAEHIIVHTLLATVPKGQDSSLAVWRISGQRWQGCRPIIQEPMQPQKEVRTTKLNRLEG